MASLQSHFLHTMSHWSSGLPSRHEGPAFKPQGGYLWETGILLLALSHYIGNPDMIGPVASSPFSGCFTRLCADNVSADLISHSFSVLVSCSLQVLLPASQLTESPAGGEPCGEPAISLHSHHASLVQWTTRLLPVMRDPGSNPWGILCETEILLLALSCYRCMVE